MNGSLASEEAPEEGIYEHDNSVLCSVVCRLRALRRPTHVVVGIPTSEYYGDWQPPRPGALLVDPHRECTVHVPTARPSTPEEISHAHVLQINPTFAPDARFSRRLAAGVVR